LALVLSPQSRARTPSVRPPAAAGDDEPVALEALDDALGDDVRHGLGRLGFRKPRIAGQRRGNADRQVSRIGGRELVVGVGHAEDDIRVGRT
jgi:hypothetical protein